MESPISQVLRLLNTTTAPVFLTGKAGTGKTTFLRNLQAHTHKRFIVVAPTGIAALNAGGVTIHSQFLLPPLTFIPDRSFPDAQLAGRMVTPHGLARQHPLNSARKQVLRAIDLLVIDEVSMLRADLLDAIDYRLRAARGHYHQPFGGVQLLLIGDLYQLPPVIAREEADVLGRYYKSAWFYEALALREQPPVYIELTHIYRQQDAHFIALLNNLRNNYVTPADLDMLNRQYQPDRPAHGVITLTTHNYRADEINQRELRKLPGSSVFFHASVEGDFPEKLYPVQARIELKEGAQVMFTRNDTSEAKAYVNGQLATVAALAPGEIEVVMNETKQRYTLKTERWENKKYMVAETTHHLQEEVVGFFEQYPVKLAWAITVHKSQGLTFDSAVLDVGNAFAPGQVYVALSRLRSLEGLILRAPIPANAISTDGHVAEYTREHHQPDRVDQLILEHQQHYIQELLEHTFDFQVLTKDIQRARKSEPELPDPTLQPVWVQVAERLQGEQANTHRFRDQLLQLLRQRDYDRLRERLDRGAAYYRTFLWDVLHLVLAQLESVKRMKRVKSYTQQLVEFYQAVMKKMESVDHVYSLVTAILYRHERIDIAPQAAQRSEKRQQILSEVRRDLPPTSEVVPRRKARKSAKGDGRSTYDVTLDLWKSGHTAGEIARERGLALTTIEGHLARAIETGRLELHALVTPEEETEIVAALSALDSVSLKALHEALGKKVSYGKLRAVLAAYPPPPRASESERPT